jgi:hypothetical protein
LHPWGLQAGLPLLAGLALLAAVLVLGRLARDELRARGHYAVAFADVDCDPPPGLSREAFLGEVQYLAGLPDHLDLLEPGLSERLAGAFAAHPWVEEVGQVEKVAPAGLRVHLRHRSAVLAVRPAQGPRRAVDRHGVLLPLAADQADLPRFAGPAGPPTGRPGSPWGGPTVEAAARTAAALLPHLDRLGLCGCTVEVTPAGVVLHAPRVRVLWGHAPGQEPPDEPDAGAKLQRLLEAAPLAGNEHDVRPAGGPKRRALGG